MSSAREGVMVVHFTTLGLQISFGGKVFMTIIVMIEDFSECMYYVIYNIVFGNFMSFSSVKENNLHNIHIV